ncbi:helix-turn-helix transcriptional regulator [Methanolobus zinderi]|uniref:Helix-turn-helix transcriptional regulator n=1 Tax=Methanolobus zinderi TaxID=536044 RepID=A0A7D5I9K5_9EURY|nr:helix-turn-helix domain-containing protein [Methanolobus zinderi]QLC50462.1 helix-turn-helix transcriptional regulator [Methanolobus zinderi]
MKKTEDFETEFSEIKSKLFDIHNDMKSFIEHANQQHMENVLQHLKKDYNTTIANHLTDEIRIGLSKNMVRKCERKDECTSIFTDLLDKNTDMIRKDRISGRSIEENRAKMDELKGILPYKKCDKCYSELTELFSKQVNLMHSMNIYDMNREQGKDMRSLPIQTVVDDILEPVCHPKRMEILRAVYTETRTFSSLSEITGLRGGNLLFHLQKLSESGLIMQRHERGDYMITARGFRIMEGVSDIHTSLNTDTEKEKIQI